MSASGRRPLSRIARPLHVIAAVISSRWMRIELPKINAMLEGRGLRRIEPTKVSP